MAFIFRLIGATALGICFIGCENGEAKPARALLSVEASQPSDPDRVDNPDSVDDKKSGDDKKSADEKEAESDGARTKKDHTPLQSDAEVDDVKPFVCLRRALPFISDEGKRCFTREEIQALRHRRLMESSERALEMQMVHPSDFSVAPAIIETCAAYGEKSGEGWYAMRTRDMRREAFFTRACGLISMIDDAEPLERSTFLESPITLSEIAELAPGQFPRFSDDDAFTPSDPEIEMLGEGRWRVSAGDRVLRIEELAELDFDHDGAGEMLSFVFAAIKDGSAILSSIILLERDDGVSGLVATPVTFPRKPDSADE